MQYLAVPPCEDRRSTDAARLASLDDVQHFFDRRAVVHEMDLIEIHLVGAEQARAARLVWAQIALRKASAVWACGHLVADDG
jgi:hypothetical protein